MRVVERQVPTQAIMIRENEENESGSSETRRRVKIVVLGILASVLAGAVLFFVTGFLTTFGVAFFATGFFFATEAGAFFTAFTEAFLEAVFFLIGFFFVFAILTS